ncbi:MAG TPA: hypothetical protein VJS38_01335 [Phenylobacterium sp.]|uniref:hypothetical protein n=1 Tax=Phenylobacterium sp. TaxID=1871053 RepID=UPI002B47C23C|nr:hypothetical protein [Phenylobacterium sp.]HKR86793.1 hypothetical protein [Phenylobacterium sp.]
MKRLPSWIVYAALGPVSGTLTAGIVRSWRKGERLLAALYAIALIEFFTCAPLALKHMASMTGVG